MVVLLLILGATGSMLAVTVKFAGPKPEFMIPIAVTGLLACVCKLIWGQGQSAKQDFAKVRRVLLEEIGDVSLPPTRIQLNDIEAQIGIKLDKYFDYLANGSIIDKGIKALVEQEYKTAAELFAKYARTQLKEAAVSWFFEGNALYFQEEYREAATAYQKSTNFNPRLAKAWYNWGVTLDALGQHDKAMEKYRKALELDPGLTGNGCSSSEALVDNNQHEKALVIYKQYSLELDFSLAQT